MDDGFNPSQTVTVALHGRPAASERRAAGPPGSVVSASGDITVNWTRGHVPVPVRVSVEDEPTIGGAFGNGSRVVRVTVTRLSDGTALADASTSRSSSSSTQAPRGRALVLGGRRRLVAGAASSPRTCSRRASPTATSSTRRAPCTCSRGTSRTSACSRPRRRSWRWRVSGSVVRLPGGARRISVTVQVTKGARVVATLYSPHGRAREDVVAHRPRGRVDARPDPARGRRSSRASARSSCGQRPRARRRRARSRSGCASALALHDERRDHPERAMVAQRAPEPVAARQESKREVVARRRAGRPESRRPSCRPTRCRRRS